MTVVTITRNNLAGLQRTMASLAAQDFRDVQHVVIDGASTDGTVEWLGTHRVFDDTMVISEPDRGIYDAMNKGAAHATGSLVNFLNAGDAYARPSVLADVVADHLAGDWKWGFGLARVVDSSGQPVRPVRPARYAFRDHALGLIVVSHQAVFMRKDLLIALGGFDEQVGVPADTDLLLRAAEVATPTVWNRVDIEYLRGGASDRDVYRALYRKHLIRRALRAAARSPEAASLPPPSIDLAWTGWQILSTAGRKIGKRILNRLSGGAFTRWWAARGM